MDSESEIKGVAVFSKQQLNANEKLLVAFSLQQNGKTFKGVFNQKEYELVFDNNQIIFNHINKAFLIFNINHKKAKCIRYIFQNSFFNEAVTVFDINDEIEQFLKHAVLELVKEIPYELV